jgi:hypothetical protein
MVLFVAAFFETHVFIITSFAICPWPGHQDHLMAIVYYTRLL